LKIFDKDHYLYFLIVGSHGNLMFVLCSSK